MDKIDINTILNRNDIYENIKSLILNFDTIKKNPLSKKGIYIYGEPGSGKSKFISSLLNDINHDIILYDTGEIRNKNIIDTLNQHNLSNYNVVSLFNKNKKQIAIIMDEIDGMNSGDKGGINSLIKIIRPKKTKKQKLEETIHLPIICIGNYIIDKKIKELIKVCHTFEIKYPTSEQINLIIKKLFKFDDNELVNKLNIYIQNDLRKLNTIYKIYKKNPDIINKFNIDNIFITKKYNEDTKDITKKLILNKYKIDDHLQVINETERTIISLLWHENIIDLLDHYKIESIIYLYLKILDNICFADYIDRITFQKQIWQFNEMSSLIKIFYNNNLLHDSIAVKNYKMSVRFTKVLTKYSTEYNNSLFIINLCQNLNFDKKDLISFFYKKIKSTELNLIYEEMENFELNKLDVNRIYRYINRLLEKNFSIDEDQNSEEDNNSNIKNENIEIIQL
tara:strand:+ start:25 stop:1377 length:1353 start_codon:yes stop_codon:yes gene_type:complete